MKKLLKIVIILALLIASVFAGFMIMKNAKQSKEEKTDITESKTEDKTKPEITDQRLTEILEHMTLEQKIGQMLIIRNSYTEMTPEFETDISEIQPGGYIIFNVNITTLAGTKQLIADSRKKMEDASTVTMEDDTTQIIPAFMSADQEGGLVQRLQAITDYPPEYIEPMSEIGASGSVDKAYETGRLLAEECKSVGLDLDYAPVADIFSNPENTVIGNRAFGTDKDTVATMSTALARGLRESGVTPVFKHFPGHGDTAVDSHQSLPVVTKTLDELKQNELFPFQKAIDDGAEMIMVAHIALPSVTGDYTPASLSPGIVTGVLRKQLGFSGLIITDGLDMGALTQNYSNAEIAVKAVEAGADLLLTPASPTEAKNALLEAVKSGALNEARIDESVLKILKLKLQYL